MAKSALICFVCVWLPTARALRGTTPPYPAVQSECEGGPIRTWVQEGPIKRLKGPVFNIHIPGPYHSAGRFMVHLAANIGNMEDHTYQRWADLKNTELWKDMHWIDLEDRIPEGHTLRDLGCGTGKATILSTIVRHPLNMFLRRWYACEDLKNIRKHNSEANAAQRGAGNAKTTNTEYGLPTEEQKKNLECQDDTPVCQPGEEACEYDNIILQAFTGVSAASLTRAHLEQAKSRLRNFDVIFVVEHLSHTLQLTTTRLGWRPDQLLMSLNATLHKAEESEDQERFPKGEITHEQWQAVAERNSLDIELYDYMRELSFGMMQADGLPVPPEDERIVTPQWENEVLRTRRGSLQEARIE